MNLNRRVPNGLPGGVRGRKFYYFLLLDYAGHDIYLDSESFLWGLLSQWPTTSQDQGSPS